MSFTEAIAQEAQPLGLRVSAFAIRALLIYAANRSTGNVGSCASRSASNWLNRSASDSCAFCREPLKCCSTSSRNLRRFPTHLPGSGHPSEAASRAPWKSSRTEGWKESGKGCLLVFPWTDISVPGNCAASATNPFTCVLWWLNTSKASDRNCRLNRSVSWNDFATARSNVRAPGTAN